MYYIGIDATSKYGRVVAINEDMEVISSHSGKCINTTMLEQKECIENFKSLMGQFATLAGLSKDLCGAVVIGCIKKDDKLINLYEQILSIEEYNCLITTINEATMITCAENILDKPAIIVKTEELRSFVCYDNKGTTDKCGDWGNLIVDIGSSYWIGLEGIKSACASFDGLILESQLTQKIIEHCGLSDIRNLTYILDKEIMGKEGIKQLSVIVKEAAKLGDLIAMKIEAEAGKGLFLMAKAIIDRNNIKNCTVILVGDNLAQEGGIYAKFSRLLEKEYPESNIIFSRYKNEIGAAIKAKELAYLQ